MLTHTKILFCIFLYIELLEIVTLPVKKSATEITLNSVGLPLNTSVFLF